jgi:EAL domain-containing protein (putative c-di-GMP-specific phosphodiesterase class I)
MCLRAAPSRRAPLALMTAGLVAIAASDTAFAYLTATDGYSDHHEIAVGWAWGLVLLGVAALSATRDRSVDAASRTAAVSRWLPYVPVLLSAVLCTPVLIAGLGPVFVAVAVIVVAVVIRQVMILGENRRLRSDAASAPPAPVASPMLDELRDAIDHSGLRILYQPQLDLRTRRIVGMEALIRWPHPCRGLLNPDQFLPLVNQRVLMRALTDAVLDLALDDAARWYAGGFRVPVAVNVFAPTISDPELGPAIVEGLHRRGLPPEALIVEITEDRLLADMQGTRAALTSLRDKGIRIALDDFGSGYSALWHLRDLPVDQVKLDREFIAPILTDPTSATIARTVIGMAHALGLTPVAEGVENAEVVAQLCEYGCRMAQGFYFSRPLPAADMLALLEAQGRDDAAVPQVVTDLTAPDAVKSS